MDVPISLEAWLSATDDIFAVLLTDVEEPDEGYYDKAISECGLQAAHIPIGKHRSLWNAIVSLKESKQPINPNTIMMASGGAITLNWYAELVALADSGWDDTIRGNAFISNVSIVRDYGEIARTKQLLMDADKDIGAGKNKDHVVDRLVSDLTNSSIATMRDVTITGTSIRLRSFMDQPQLPIVSTGIDFLDKATGGLLPNQLWFLAGAYKSSKTRIATNMLLTNGLNGVSSAMLSRENPEMIVGLQMVCMLAIKYIMERVPYNYNESIYWLGITDLIRARNTYKNWQPKLKVEAVDYGIRTLAEMKKTIRVYDPTSDGGKLSDMTSIRMCINRDKRLYGGEKFYIDHLGLIKGGGDSIYEKTASTSKELQALSREDSNHPITLMVLAQLNENTINSDEGYSPGVKGGGDPPADADVMLTTRPVEIQKGEYHNDRTRLKVKHSRFGSSDDSEVIFFHPASGLIISDPNTQQRGNNDSD